MFKNNTFAEDFAPIVLLLKHVKCAIKEVLLKIAYVLNVQTIVSIAIILDAFNVEMDITLMIKIYVSNVSYRALMQLILEKSV